MSIRKIIKKLASLKLAVVIILSLAICIAYGTIMESQYDAETAQKLVYHSWFMYALMLMLCATLIAVMADRWPWKPKHIGFILAHIGIIVLMFGSVLTRYYGIDGSIVFEIGQTNKYVVVSEPEINVYSSFGDAGRFVNIYHKEHDFLVDPLPKGGLIIPTAQYKLEVLDFLPYSMREEKIVASDAPGDGPAVYFQLQNPKVSLTQWINLDGRGKQEAVKELGPAKVVLTRDNYMPDGRNAVVIKPRPDNESLTYQIFTASSAAAGKKPVKEGVVKAGETVETGWMGLVLRVLKYMPHAKQDVIFHKRERPTELTVPSIKVRFNNQERWMGIDSVLKFFTEDSVYFVSYGHRRIDLGQIFNEPDFNLFLKKFEVGRYQGTMRAATYQSLVTVPNRGDVLISMNEPLKYKGFTFYQSSFQEDPATGKPVASILSVNFDPGRGVKYLGSLLIVLGIIHLFWFRQRAKKKAA